MKYPPKVRTELGFTLAELLIALGIIGVIATFTIPKILASQQNTRFKAVAKEAMASLSGAYQAYQLENQASANTTCEALIPYLNYVKTQTTDIDATPGSTNWECGNWGTCIQLHNGAVIAFPSYKFGGTTANHYLLFVLDPDGQYSNTTNGEGKSLEIMLHFNGKLKTTAERRTGVDVTYEDWSGNAVYWGADPAPDWFSWN